MKRHRPIDLRQIPGAAVFYLVLVLFTIVCLLPFFWAIVSSFKPNAELFSYPPRVIAKDPSLEGWIYVFKNPETLRSLWNSVWMTSVAVFVVIALAAVSGYGMSRFQFRGKGMLRIAILVTQMLPPIFVLIPYFGLVNFLGLWQTYGALLLGWCTFPVPFATLLLWGIFNSIPTELDDAAMIDGCSRLGALFRVVLRVSLPGLLGAGAVVFISIWGDLLLVIIMARDPAMFTVVAFLSSQVSLFTQRWNALAVLSLVASVPLVVVWMFSQRYVVRGMTAGFGK